jgi:hypothetical protein
MKNDDKTYRAHQSPIPPHLTTGERDQWEKELEWQEKEYERRKKEGLYDPQKYKRKRGRPSSKKKYEMTPFHTP